MEVLEYDWLKRGGWIQAITLILWLWLFDRYIIHVVVVVVVGVGGLG